MSQFITLASSTATRLAQLLLLLSSDQPGEIINAARAIGQTLQNAGADWHDLTAKLLTQPQIKALPDANDDDWWVMRERCIEHQYLLRPRELQFVINLDRWYGDLTPAGGSNNVYKRGRSFAPNRTAR